MLHCVSTTQSQFLFLYYLLTFCFISSPSVPLMMASIRKSLIIMHCYCGLLFVWISVYLRLFTGFYLTFRRTKCLFFLLFDADICLPISFSYPPPPFLIIHIALAVFPFSFWFLIYISFNLHVFCSIASCSTTKPKIYATTIAAITIATAI